MPFKVYCKRGGIVLTRETDVGQRLEDLPGGLEGTSDSVLRWNGSAIEDASDNTTFYIDSDGNKCLFNDAATKNVKTATITFDRRAANDDRIQRTTGSFVTDGFSVGDIVSISGSVSNDNRYKVTTVNALSMLFDKTASRIAVDETTPVSCTIETGFQRIESMVWGDQLIQNSSGIWNVKTNAEKHDDAKTTFRTETIAYIDQWISQKGGTYPSRRREEAELFAAQARIADNSTSFTVNDLAKDADNFGGSIYDETSASQTGLTLTFSASGHTVTRSAGDWSTDGFRRPMQVTFSNTTSNNKTFTIASVSATVLTLSSSTDDPNVSDETSTAGCDANGLYTITGYTRWRSDDNPAEVGVAYWTQFMEGSVINRWFDELRISRRSWISGATNSTIWTASTSYSVDDIVFEPAGELFYECNEAHTSQSTFAADSSKWDAYLATGVTLDNYPTTQLAT